MRRWWRSKLGVGYGAALAIAVALAS